MLKSREDSLFGPVNEALVPMIELKEDRNGRLSDQKLLHPLTL
jgi:hypothetical protein